MLEVLTTVFRVLVRPTITWIGFGALTLGFLRGQVSTEVYLPLVALTVGFYFGARSDVPPNGPKP